MLENMPGRSVLAEIVTQAVVFTSKFTELASKKKKKDSRQWFSG